MDKKIIGRLRITQKGYPVTTFTFVDNITIEAQLPNKGDFVTVYKQEAAELLRDLNWMTQFTDRNRVDEEMKTWRR